MGVTSPGVGTTYITFAYVAKKIIDI